MQPFRARRPSYGMRLFVLLLVLTACGTQAGAPERACPAIGVRTGIAVRSAPSVAARFEADRREPPG